MQVLAEAYPARAASWLSSGLLTCSALCAGCPVDATGTQSMGASSATLQRTRAELEELKSSASVKRFKRLQEELKVRVLWPLALRSGPGHGHPCMASPLLTARPRRRMRS